MNEIQAAWLAGFYEGEGSLTILRKPSGRPLPQFCLTSTDEDVLRRFADLIGVGNTTGPRRRGTNKPFWSWRAHGWAVAEFFLERIGYYLGSRRQQRLYETLAQKPLKLRRVALVLPVSHMDHSSADAGETQLAWASGLFEAEGSMSLLKTNTRPYPQFALASTDHDVVVKFAKTLQVGRVTGPYQPSCPNRKPRWSWRGCGWMVVRLFASNLVQHFGARRTARFQEIVAAEPSERVWVAHNQKLLPVQVVAIRQRLEAGESQTSLGREYGITQAQVWKIKEGRTYKHVS